MSITISKEQLKTVLSDYFPEEDSELFEDIYEELEEETFTYLGDAGLFDKLLTLYRRRELHHKGVSMGNSNRITYLESIMPKVNGFCSTYNLPRRDGYIQYIKLGCKFLPKNKFNLNVFDYKVESIYQLYEEQQTIINDKNPDITEILINSYKKGVATKTGILFKPTPEDTINFVTAAVWCKKQRVLPEVLVEATFDMLAWKNAIPSTGALINPKFQNHVADYMSKNDLVNSNTTLILDLKKIKNLRDD